MKRVAVGIYREPLTKKLYHRPWINGARTWRVLRSATVADAIKERRDWKASWNPTVGELAAMVGGLSKSMEGHLRRAMPFWRNTRISDARQRLAAHNRKKQPTPREADLEAQAVSSVLHRAVRAGLIEANPLASRPRLWSPSRARHARDRMPASSREFELILGKLSAGRNGKVLALLARFIACTGLRISEAIRLRKDASFRQPGFIENGWLWLKRSKQGVNPFVVISLELEPVLAAILENRDSQWFFPSPRNHGHPLELRALTRALRRASAGKVTAHGLRAYYVTRRRSLASDARIAAEIGDKTVRLISEVYGSTPPEWLVPGQSIFIDHGLHPGLHPAREGAEELLRKSDSSHRRVACKAVALTAAPIAHPPRMMPVNIDEKQLPSEEKWEPSKGS